VVDRGIYGVCRHPLHKGLVLEIAGMALVNGHFTAFLLFGVALVFFFVRGVQEEKALLAGIGDSYRDYLVRVRSLVDLLPAPWRAHAPDRAGDGGESSPADSRGDERP
jgi:protein-S-isoprenylcysteine O-methyltransferase Ste14